MISGPRGERDRQGAVSVEVLRIGLFVLLPALNALMPFVILPAITRHLGQQAWVDYAVAQSIGSAAAVLVELGWGLTGTQKIARQRADGRRLLVALVTVTKLVALTPTLGLVVVVVVLAMPQSAAVSGVIAATGAFASLSLTWAFIGLRRPLLILLVDSLPRVTGYAVAAIAISHGGSIWWLAFCGLGAAVFSFVVGLAVLGVRGWHFRRFRRAHWMRALRSQGSVLSARIVSALYIALPVALVSLVAPVVAVAVFAAAERIQRMVLTALQSVPNAMQGWVGAGSTATERWRRARLSIIISAVVGMVTGSIVAALLPWLSRLLFSGVADIPAHLAILSGILVLTVSVSRATGSIALVAVGKVQVIAVSAALGATIGAPAIVVLAARLGAGGGLLGEIIAEATVLGVQMRALMAEGRRRRVHGAS